MKLHALGGFSDSLEGLSCPLTAIFHAANMLNTHEDLRSRPSTWMVSGFLPHIDPGIAKYPKEGGNSVSVRNVELMGQCSECLFQGWNETYADPLPMEFADGKTRAGVLRAYYPGGRCDSAADTGDGSRLWYVNTWAMKWSQKE